MKKLKITPKLYCDISFSEKSKKLHKLINNNLNLIKQVGRINGVIENKIDDKNTIDIYNIEPSINFNELKMIYRWVKKKQ